MNHYIMIHRLRGPLLLILAGSVALLNRMGIIDHFWHWFLPLMLILLGLLMLAERAVMASYGGYPPFPGTLYPGAPDPLSATGVQPYPGQPEAYIPSAHSGETDTSSEGGQS
jgi:hypothetical protein